MSFPAALPYVTDDAAASEMGLAGREVVDSGVESVDVCHSRLATMMEAVEVTLRREDDRLGHDAHRCRRAHVCYRSPIADTLIGDYD